MDFLIFYGLNCVCIKQVCSSRDISRSSTADASENSSNQRLLRLKLTDGHSEITAVEYSHVPSIPDDISPGTKVFNFSNFLKPISLSHVI